MKNFCKSMKEHAKNVISFEKNKMKPLTKEELKQRQYVNVYYICRKKIFTKFGTGKNYRKVRALCHYTGKFIWMGNVAKASSKEF